MLLYSKACLQSLTQKSLGRYLTLAEHEERKYVYKIKSLSFEDITYFVDAYSKAAMAFGAAFMDSRGRLIRGRDGESRDLFRNGRRGNPHKYPPIADQSIFKV